MAARRKACLGQEAATHRRLIIVVTKVIVLLILVSNSSNNNSIKIIGIVAVVPVVICTKQNESLT